jgi:hypothetical protein
MVVVGGGSGGEVPGNESPVRLRRKERWPWRVLRLVRCATALTLGDRRQRLRDVIPD